MSEHFIKNIEIKNFKCFEDFKAEGFGRVNLIGGKNNVGKTAFMEACYLSTNYEFNSKRVIDFYSKIIEFNTYRDGVNLKYKRDEREDDIDDLIEFSNDLEIIRENFNRETYYTDIEINKLQYKFSIQDRNIANYKETYSYRELVDLLDNNIRNTKKIYKDDFLVASSSYPNYMFDYLISEIKVKFKEEELNTIVSKLFKFNKIDILRGKPVIFGNKIVFSLKDLGQGIKSFIYNIASLLLATDKVLFIDEIENGLHYSLFDEMWQIILTISKQQNVQVFATTHSKECIESYARIAKKLEDKEITFIKMTQLKDGKIMAGVRDYDMLQYTINDGHEVRGV